MKNIILAILLGMLLVGCIGVLPETNAVTELREYSITFDEKGTKPDFTVVGIGKWVKASDGDVFRISSYDGEEWELSPPLKIEESAVSLDSYKRIKKETKVPYE